MNARLLDVSMTYHLINLTLAGRVFFGWLSDRGYVTALAINNFSLLACGFLCAIAPLCHSFVSLVIYASLFGFIICEFEIAN